MRIGPSRNIEAVPVCGSSDAFTMTVALPLSGVGSLTCQWLLSEPAFRYLLARTDYKTWNGQPG